MLRSVSATDIIVLLHVTEKCDCQFYPCSCRPEVYQWACYGQAVDMWALGMMVRPHTMYTDPLLAWQLIYTDRSTPYGCAGAVFESFSITSYTSLASSDVHGMPRHMCELPHMHPQIYEMLTGGNFESMKLASSSETGVALVLADVRETLPRTASAEDTHDALDLVRMLLQRSPYRYPQLTLRIYGQTVNCIRMCTTALPHRLTPLMKSGWAFSCISSTQ